MTAPVNPRQSGMADLLRYRDEARVKYQKAVRCSRMGDSQGANGQELDRLYSQEQRFLRAFHEAQRAVDAALGEGQRAS